MSQFKKFPNIAKFVQTSRLQSKLSQQELSLQLGYNNGQFISNVERGLCSLPSTKYKILCKALNVFPQELERALMLDHEFTVKRKLYPEKLQSLLKEYESCEKENTNSYRNKIN